MYAIEGDTSRRWDSVACASMYVCEFVLERIKRGGNGLLSERRQTENSFEGRQTDWLVARNRRRFCQWQLELFSALSGLLAELLHGTAIVAEGVWWFLAISAARVHVPGFAFEFSSHRSVPQQARMYKISRYVCERRARRPDMGFINSDSNG